MPEDGTGRNPEDSMSSENPSRFPTLIENSPVAIGISRGGVTVYGNKMYLKLFGFQSANEIHGRPILENWAPQSRAEIAERVRRRALGLPVSTEYEAIAQRGDGSQFPVQVAVTTAQLEDGPATAAFFWDLTERKKAEESLRESEERFRKVFEVGPLAMVISGLDNRYLDANQAFCTMLGYTKEELAKLTFSEITHPEDQERDLSLAKQVFEGKIPNFRIEKRYIRKDGKLVWTDLAATVVRDSGGKILHGLAMVEDITERKHAVEELQRVSERLVLATRAAGMGIWDWDIVKNELVWDDEMYRLYGIRKEDFGGAFEAWAKCVAPQDFDRVSRETQAALRGEHEFDSEFRVVWQDGSLHYIKAASQTFRDEAGHPLRMVGVNYDITKQKRAEASLRHRERDLEDAQRLAQVGSWVWDATTAAVSWSQGMYHVTGRDPKLPPPQTPEEFHAIFPTETWARLDAAGLETLRTGVPFELEAEIIASDGTRKWVISRAEVEREPGGNPIRLRGTVQDINERKRAVAALLDSEERYRLLFQRNFAGVIRTTLDGRVLECNQSFARIYGYDSVEEVLPVNVRDFYYEETGRDSFLKRLKQEKVVVGYEYQARRKDGRPAWVLISSSLVEDEKQGPTILSTILDITRWRELGEHLRQAQKMDAVGRLAGGVAHDFNNMLQIINGYSELLLDGIPPQDPMREFVEEIKKSVDRSAGLTRQLLAFSRQQVLTPQVLDLNKVIANSTKMIRRLIGEDVKLRMTQGHQLSPVKVDPVRIDQVILNLAINARDAMPKGGKLIIQTANVGVDEDFTRAHLPMTPGPYVLLRVSDTGDGMDAETRSHIFEPFFTTKEKGKGTGLGLATVYGIVKQSGGYIWVQSELKKGTTFAIYLPPAERTSDSKDEQAIPAAPGGPETVLMVEDEKEVRALVRRMIESKGYKVLEARNGREALRVAKQHEGSIQLLLTDVVLPGMNGRVLAERLLRLRPEMKVIFLSGYTDDAVTRQGGLIPGSHLLQKPVAPDVLTRKVREVLDGP